MRTVALVSLVAASLALATAQVPPPPQTARQALLEMLLAKSPDALEKHLPEAARSALLRSADTFPTPILRELNSFRNGILGSDEQLETFDSGSVLLTVDDERTHRRIEILVESDNLMGDADEIELSFHPYVDGKPEPLPVRPRVVLSLQQEKEVWKLYEVTVAMHAPLADPDFLKDLQKSQNPASESSAVGSLRTLLTAEISYSATFPGGGFTCNLSELGSSGAQSEPDQQHAMLIDDALASGKRGGYIFSISGCDGPSASRIQITAVPVEPDLELRAFCSDESATIRYSADGQAATCLSQGMPLE